VLSVSFVVNKNKFVFFINFLNGINCIAAFGDVWGVKSGGDIE
jgi:hypothetical protein